MGKSIKLYTMITAEEFLNKEDNNLHTYYYPDGNTTKPKIHDDNCKFCNFEDSIVEIMIEFTKLHREAILKEIAEDYSYYLEGDEGSERLDKKKFFKEVYPLNNIK